jgi:uncharacterized protein (DUF58 family)
MRRLYYPEREHQENMLDAKSSEGVESGEEYTGVNKRWYYLGLLLIAIGIPFHQALFVVIGIVALLVCGLIDTWARYCLTDLRYERRLGEQRVFFGEEIALSVSIENAKLLPLPWLEIEDTVPRVLTIKGQELRGGLLSNTIALECLFSPRWYERVTRRYTVQCHARGVHTFGPTKLRSGDIFGFISREILLSNRQYLLVYPLVIPLTRFGLPARHPFGEQRAPRRLLEDPSRVIGVRDYAYGDSLRRIHWKATARTMQLQSKIYEATTTHALVIFLNVIARLDTYYGIHPELQELAICAAASVTNWALDQGYAVGLYANTIMFMPDEMPSFSHQQALTEQPNLEGTVSAQLERRRIRLPASSSGEQRQRIMEVLARTQTYFGTNIEDIIQTERSHLPAGSTVVVITSTMSEALLDILARVRRSGHAVSILFTGDTPAPVRLAGITIYHLGGEETWKDLEAAYSGRSEETAKAAFRL